MTFGGPIAQADYLEAQTRYRLIRHALYADVVPRIQGLLVQRGWPHDASLVDIAGIDPKAINAWQGDWPMSPLHDANFPWDKIISWARKRPRRIEVAIWYNQTLCGLAIGRGSKGTGSLVMQFIESRPGAHPMRGYVALIALVVADQFASYLGNRYVKLRNPNAGAIPRYEALGFRKDQSVNGSRYHSREVD